MKLKVFSFWKDMPRERQRKIEVTIGLLAGAFALFTLLAILSYLFTWKADQSLDGYARALDQDVPVSNLAGKLGFKWSHLLVCKCFGLGSLAFVVILGVISLRLLFGKRSYSIVRVLLLSVTGALVASFIFAFISNLLGLDTVFGGGLGGGCGNVMVSFFDNLFGSLLTFCILAILVVLWLIFASSRFSKRIIGEREKKPAKERAKKERDTFTWIKDAVKDEINAAEASEEDELPEVAEAVEEQQPVPEEQQTEVEVEPLPNTLTEPVPETPEVQEETDENIDIVEPEPLSTDVNEPLPRIDVRSDLDKYKFPSLEILGDYEDKRQSVSQEELMRNNYKIRATLKNYKIEVENVKAVVGPTVTLYKVYPAPGVKIAAIRGRQEDIGMALKAKGVRVVTLEDSVGIEVANDNPSMVPLKAMLNDDAFRNTKAELPVAIGYTITQEVKVFDLADAPHLLVAGATKQGKSVGLNVLITSLLYKKHPSELKFVFIDPKMVEFSAYAGLLKHYLAVLPSASEQQEKETAICKNPKQAEAVLRSLCQEMDDRYLLMSKALVSKVTLYNEKYQDRHLLPTEGHRYMPYIVVVVDEYADLTMTVGATGDSKAIARSISTSIVRLAQKGRAAGIHVVLATQRPSVDVITGLIKANFPTRIAFRVFSGIDSKTILDSPGAEKLIGNGDMIYLSGADTERVQCAFISGKEINEICRNISEQQGYKKSYNTPYYLPEPESEDGEDSGGGMVDMKNLDPRFEEAARMVVTTQRGSTSDIQRRLGMGYARSGKVMDQLQAAGIVGPQEGSKPRQVLVSDLAELDSIIQAYKNANE